MTSGVNLSKNLTVSRARCVGEPSCCNIQRIRISQVVNLSRVRRPAVLSIDRDNNRKGVMMILLGGREIINHSAFN